jgi:hypothetical protein
MAKMTKNQLIDAIAEGTQAVAQTKRLIPIDRVSKIFRR